MINSTVLRLHTTKRRTSSPKWCTSIPICRIIICQTCWENNHRLVCDWRSSLQFLQLLQFMRLRVRDRRTDRADTGREIRVCILCVLDTYYLHFHVYMHHIQIFYSSHTVATYQRWSVYDDDDDDDPISACAIPPLTQNGVKASFGGGIWHLWSALLVKERQPGSDGQCVHFCSIIAACLSPSIVDRFVPTVIAATLLIVGQSRVPVAYNWMGEWANKNFQSCFYCEYNRPPFTTPVSFFVTERSSSFILPLGAVPKQPPKTHTCPISHVDERNVRLPEELLLTTRNPSVSKTVS